MIRFGLAGTGHWARVAHAQALSSVPGIDFGAVWGRNAAAGAALAADFGVRAYLDFEEFLADVDAVAFSVPPDVQAELAVIAARAGRHLLLEKPVALTEAAADALTAAVHEAGVASVVFFTALFQPDSRAWLADASRTAGWQGATALWLSSVYEPSSPFNTPWRREKGALWDLGPHVVALLWTILGPVESVTADAGPGDVTHLVLHHHGGVTSSGLLTLGAAKTAGGFDLTLWGEPGRACLPALADDPVPAARAALTELAEAARSGTTGHWCDVRFGRDVTRILAAAQRQIDERLP